VTDRHGAAQVPLVLGVGNENRGDDAAGLLVARLLRPRLAGVATVSEVATEGTELLDQWEGREFVVAVDAIRTGAPSGTVLRWASGSGPLPTPLSTVSSHGISLGQAVALGETLGRFPGSLVLYGIEGTEFTAGAAASVAVEAALEPTARRVEDEVRAYLATVRRGGEGGVFRA
jgi:hydrogenase maturation protease